MNNYTLQEKQIIITILVAIMEADGILVQQETDFLNEIIMAFDISQETLEQTDDLDFNFIVERFKSFESHKKQEAIALFLQMAKCDGYVDPRELKIIENLGS